MHNVILQALGSGVKPRNFRRTACASSRVHLPLSIVRIATALVMMAVN